MRLAELLVVGPDAEPDDPPGMRGRRRAALAVTIVTAGALLGATLRVEEGSTGFTVLGLLAAGTGSPVRSLRAPSRSFQGASAGLGRRSSGRPVSA